MKIKLSVLSRLRRKLAAFSLIESVVAMGVIGTVVGAMISGVATGTFTMRMARENLRATQIMLAKLETIRLYNWDQVLSNGFVKPTFTDIYDPQGATGSQGVTYTGYVSISNCPAPISTKSYATNMRQLTITLNWKTGTLGRTRSVTTYIARDGIQNYVY